jgi:hypothetical protein
MESINLDWMNDPNLVPDLSTPELPIFDAPSPATDRIDAADDEHALPLLRLSNWNRNKHYDKNNPECIHYDLKWKISQRENIRARQVYVGSDSDLVLAPSDYWTLNFQARLKGLLEDKDKFPGESYMCEEVNIVISIERSRQRGLSERFNNAEINWDMIDNHIEGLSDLVSKGKKITLSVELVYKEVTGEPGQSKRQKKTKKKSATEAQKAQRAADAGLWARVYKHYRCRGKYCKQGPHCWPDKRGVHHKMLPVNLEDIYSDHKANMGDEEDEADVDLDIEIHPRIVQNILDNSRKRKAEGSIDHRSCKSNCSHTDTGDAASHIGDIVGDRKDILEEYCNWSLAQVTSDRWRLGLQAANQYAMDQFLELNSILQYPKFTVELMVKGGVKPGIALQFVSNIRKFQREVGEEIESP